jgi:hypothetical protein
MFGGSGAVALDGAHSWLLAPSGISTPVQSAVPPVDGFTPNQALVARDLYVRLEASPGTGKQWTFLLRSGSNQQDLSCTVSGLALHCDSGAGTISGPAHGQLFLQAQESGTPTNTTVDFSYRLTAP